MDRDREREGERWIDRGIEIEREMMALLMNTKFVCVNEIEGVCKCVS